MRPAVVPACAATLGARAVEPDLEDGRNSARAEALADAREDGDGGARTAAATWVVATTLGAIRGPRPDRRGRRALVLVPKGGRGPRPQQP